MGKLRRPKLDYEQYASDLYDRLKQFLTEKTSNQKKKTYFKGNWYYIIRKNKINLKL